MLGADGPGASIPVLRPNTDVRNTMGASEAMETDGAPPVQDRPRLIPLAKTLLRDIDAAVMRSGRDNLAHGLDGSLISVIPRAPRDLPRCPIQYEPDSAPGVDDLEDVYREAEVLRKFVGPLICLLYTSPSPRDRTRSRMPSSA